MMSNNREVVDAEWIQLITEAKNMGLEQAEIRAFLQCHLEKEAEKV
ncbi:DNA-binding anti-repressor SinI [Cytobacillus gottheilii]|uniref:Anti-repressor SinI family protein n=1 Tax=Cytobacillus gottheilii TaxID=859144 RepID=A0ABX8FHW6_9BACI|nr:DNA-binding anti-repressor SinI [Cytobacillus gottheilii]QVY63635.1 anti-repressor SinI family protein [Cytobacillus gottheilii]